MGMARKVARAAKLSIKNPSLVGKGIKNLVLYGTRGVKEKTREEMVRTKGKEIVYSIFFDACSCKREWLKATIDSVCNQNFDKWELFVLYTQEQEEDIRKLQKSLLEELEKKNKSEEDECENKTAKKEMAEEIEEKKEYAIFYQKIQSKSQAADTINRLVTEKMQGTYALMLSGENQLREDALFEIYSKLDYYYVDAFYGDHIVIDDMGSRKAPVFKPDLSVDLLCGYMYTGKTIGYRKDVFMTLGGYQEEMEELRDYELFSKR